MEKKSGEQREKGTKNFSIKKTLFFWEEIKNLSLFYSCLNLYWWHRQLRRQIRYILRSTWDYFRWTNFWKKSWSAIEVSSIEVFHDKVFLDEMFNGPSVLWHAGNLWEFRYLQLHVIFPTVTPMSAKGCRRLGSASQSALLPCSVSK